jgi:hypothetical protein
MWIEASLFFSDVSRSKTMHLARFRSQHWYNSDQIYNINQEYEITSSIHFLTIYSLVSPTLYFLFFIFVLSSPPSNSCLLLITPLSFHNLIVYLNFLLLVCSLSIVLPKSEWVTKKRVPNLSWNGL